MYPWSLVKRVKRCWDRLRRWLSINFPEAEATLNKGASEADIQELENILKVKLPLSTRILYRFCDGQELKDKSYNTSVKGNPLGLIGGYTFYDHLINVYLLPIQEIILQTRGIVRHLGFSSRSKYIVVAASSTYSEKLFFLNCSTGQLFVGTKNLRTDGEMLPCVPNELLRSVHDINGDQQQDAMLLWLEEHGRRLENGIIKVRGEGHNRSICLFPEEPPLCSTAITNGVKVSDSIITSIAKYHILSFWSIYQLNILIQLHLTILVLQISWILANCVACRNPFSTFCSFHHHNMSMLHFNSIEHHYLSMCITCYFDLLIHLFM